MFALMGTRGAFRLTSEAFEYQQLSRDQLSAEDLLSHLFLGCQQSKCGFLLLGIMINKSSVNSQNTELF